MLKSKTKWVQTENDLSQEHDQVEDSDVSPLIQNLLKQRGILTKEEIERFLNPEFEQLQSPQFLASIDIAEERIHKAIDNQERILIFGDYDADGVSSTVVLLKTLQELGAHCDFYIPNRFTEGYGPNEAAFREAHESDVSVIITVDTGIAAVDEAEIARELGIDLIITDHHEPQTVLPDAYAIIHPKISPDYIFKELAGVGVAAKLSEQLLGYFPKKYLEFIALGTIADMVPLQSENRVLAYHGLKALSQTTNPGFNALKTLCQITDDVTETDIGFKIGPHINAVGRLDDARLAVDLLMTDDPEEAEGIALEVEALNNERKDIVLDIFKEAEDMLVDQADKNILIVAKKGWHEGVLGIVASRIVRKYHRPAIVLAIDEEGEHAKGSARSIPAFDLFKNCMKEESLFESFGGHSQAAGMSLKVDNIQVLQSHIHEHMEEELSREDYLPLTHIDADIKLEDINESFVDYINQLAPFGMENPRPIFKITEDNVSARMIGKGQNHLKLQFKNGEQELDGIGFGMGESYHYINAQDIPVSVVGTLEMNEWNGHKKPQIMVKDIKISDWQVFDYRGKHDTHIDVYMENNKTLLVTDENFEGNACSVIDYNSDVSGMYDIDTLILKSFPKTMEEIQHIVREIRPRNIVASYTLDKPVYYTTFPKHEDFKWLYGFLLKRGECDLRKEINVIRQQTKWSKDIILFMIKVFFDLDFIKIYNKVITVLPQTEKKNLKSSQEYQNRILQTQLEKKLYYSKKEELKDWFKQCLDSPREVMVHGL